MTSAHSCLNQKQSLTFDRYFLAPLNAAKNFEEYICLNRVSYCHTPLNPLSRGEYQYTINSSSSKKKNSISTSPLERGRGCVTSAHSCLSAIRKTTFHYIAHELYHLFIEEKPIPHKCNPGYNKNKVEQSADMFASSLLMPETGICQLIPE